MGETDHGDAYKNLPLLPQGRSLAAVTLVCHLDGKRYYFLTPTQLFGSISAVLQYHCLSRIIASLAVRLLKIPVMGYYDDVGIINPLELIGEALFSFTDLNRIVGFKMKPKKTLAGQILEFLGVIVDFTTTPRNPPTLHLSEDRKRKVSLYIREMLSDKRASRAKLQKLLGKLNFAHTAVLGEFAGATLRPLYALSSDGTEASILTISKESEMSHTLVAPCSMGPGPKNHDSAQYLHRMDHILRCGRLGWARCSDFQKEPPESDSFEKETGPQAGGRNLHLDLGYIYTRNVCDGRRCALHSPSRTH